MKNSGQITVFLCLMMSGMLLLAMTVIGVINSLSAKEKAEIATKSVVSDVKAEYNTYIFEHYHVLLFDKTLGGLGEADIEQRLENNISKRLGENFSVEEAIVNDYTYIWQNECQELKKQIEDYTKYAVIKNEAEKLIENIGEGSDTLPNDLASEVENQDKEQHRAEENISSEKEEGKEETGSKKNNDKEAEGSTHKSSVRDPRDFTRSLNASGLLMLVLPEDFEVSAAEINTKTCISNQLKGAFWNVANTNMRFDSCSDMIKDMKSQEGWKEGLLTSACGLSYSLEVFNCATNKEINDSSVLSYELEYLVNGKNTDEKNLKKTVERIILLRFPQNYAYLLSDTARMKKVMKIARALAVKTKIPATVYKVLIAGCWSYVEGIADVRILMHGEKIPFLKSNESWITDLNNLGESIFEGQGCEEGTGYEDYIMLLLATSMDRTYLRMLDLMDVNASVDDESFDIANGATNVEIDFRITYQNKQYNIRQQGGY
ncbi:MAG: DUF5702 domain-containing protein [Clostridium sp.]|nr:DUF5702 domain-containing protein [Clostridium sp.]MCM1398630.1 DUF5702 domain-containing protein [Clostridium sp.]MCM1459916.1 DUF5702 domain-containing protein [Bacteroides sp.]